MKWEKSGHIFCSSGQYPWMVSHAANPFAEPISESIWRIYFTCRDEQQRSHISWLELDINSQEVVRIAQKPLLSPGAPGTFDDSGTALGWAITIGGHKLFYYLGWNLSVTVPWRNSIGLAKWNKDTDELDRVSLAPLLDRHHVDPFSISYPCVLFDRGRYKMWYGSNLSWGSQVHSMKHVIKYAESSDGYHWERHGTIAVGLEGAQYALSKPCVIADGDTYRMWYSYRGDSYRLGYAESPDGISWTRRDSEIGIDVSDAGWDSEMLCYAHVFKHKDECFMLYNGNGYGRTGFGLARLYKG